jgi:hypothetical protein
MGIWTVERIFDMASYAAIVATVVLLGHNLADLRQLRLAAYVLFGLIALLTLATLVMCWRGDTAIAWLQRKMGRSTMATQLAARLQAFIAGVEGIRELSSFLQVTALSLTVWLVITVAYFEVLQAYPTLQALPYSAAALLVGFSMIGGLVQLPAVGGGAQLVTILALVHVLHVPRELAVSCGILLWLVSFQAVTPAGLLLAHRLRISLRGASRNAEAVSTPLVSAASLPPSPPAQ